MSAIATSHYVPVQNGTATTALVFSILGFFTFGLTFLIGIVLGYRALHLSESRHGVGRTSALWAVWLGYSPAIALTLLICLRATITN